MKWRNEKFFKDGFLITVRVSPNAKKNEIIKTTDGIKIKIASQPVDGKANKSVIEFLSKLFKVPKSNFEIVKGQSSKDKTIFINVSDLEKINTIKQIYEKL